MLGATRLHVLGAVAAVLILAATGCGGKADPTAVPTRAPAQLVVEDLSCEDFYPGIPGPVAHWLQVGGSIANTTGSTIKDVELEIEVDGPGGVASYALEPEGATTNPFDLPVGSSIAFNASKNLAAGDPSFEGGTCRVIVSASGQELTVTGGEAVVRAFYAP